MGRTPVLNWADVSYGVTDFKLCSSCVQVVTCVITCIDDRRIAVKCQLCIIRFFAGFKFR